MRAILNRLNCHITVNELVIKGFKKLYYFEIETGTCYRFNSGVNASGHAVPILQSYKEGFMNAFEMVSYQ